MNTFLSTLAPILTPDDIPISADDRRAAQAKLDSAVRHNTLTPSQAADRQDLLAAAPTRGELRRVFAGIPAAVPPTGHTAALRVAAGVWLVACVVQFVIWLLLAGFGHLDWPWWLWSDLGLGTVVGALWWTHESYHRRNVLPVPAEVTP